MGKMTIKDLIGLKGKRKITVTNTRDPYVAKACELAGIDNITAYVDNVEDVSKAAPNTLITGAGPFGKPYISDTEAMRYAVDLLNKGADMIYTLGMLPERIKQVSAHKIACIAHVGLVPYQASWLGGFKSIGKTSEEAVKVFNDTLELQEAGVIAVEMECVPERIAEEITKRVDILTFSMGSGPDCDGQYLFACDLLGSHDDHYPRHAIKYGNFFNDSVEIFKKFKKDVDDLAYPTKQHTIEIDDNEFELFMKKIDK